MNPYDTSNCPVGHRCESCGAEDPRVAVKAVQTAVGVLCLTMCRVCRNATMEPPVVVGTAVRLTLAHCMHLGISTQEMTAAIEEL